MRKGFTLIELLVVIAIIGILSALLVANMVGIRERSRDAAAKNDLKQFKTALRLYYNDAQSYPDTDGDCADLLDDGDFLSPNGEVLMKDVAALGDFDCQYEQTAGGDGFLTSIQLLNVGDPDAEKSADRCGATVEEGVYYECAD